MELDPLLALAAALAVLGRVVFATADAALAGVSQERAEELRAEQPGRAGDALLALKQDPEGCAAALRGAGVACLAMGAALGGLLGVHRLAPLLESLSLEPVVATTLAAAASGAVIATTSLVEIVPRSLAAANPDVWALRVALPTRLATAMAGPLTRRARAGIDALLRPFGVRATFHSARPALEDIERLLVQKARADEDAPPAELVRKLFDFQTKIAKEVMVPRTRVIAVSIDAPPEELLRILAEEGHSRLPVYRGSVDEIVGVLHTRDLVPLLAHPELIRLPDALRPPVFVPWATRIGQLLRTMQRKRIHMAMVTDEYGGFMGIVTLEDILEEIVGDIRDEHDEEEKSHVEAQPDGSFVVSTRVPVHDFNRTLGVRLPEDAGYETLAGFLNELAGEIPQTGARLESHGLAFTVLERTPRRVRRVRVTREVPGAQPRESALR